MDPDHELRAVVVAVRTDAMGLAEGVRRAVALRNALPPDHPLRDGLKAFVELDAQFDLARAGYGDLAELTDRMRAAFAALG